MVKYYLSKLTARSSLASVSQMFWWLSISRKTFTLKAGREKCVCKYLYLIHRYKYIDVYIQRP